MAALIGCVFPGIDERTALERLFLIVVVQRLEFVHGQRFADVVVIVVAAFGMSGRRRARRRQWTRRSSGFHPQGRQPLELKAGRKNSLGNG